MIWPTLPIAVVILLAVIFQAPSSYAFFVRDADGAWRSVSWEKRSNPGDLLKLPLTNNNDKSYSVRYLATLPLLHLTSLITGCGADGHTVPRHINGSLAQPKSHRGCKLTVSRATWIVRALPAFIYVPSYCKLIPVKSYN